MEEVMDEQVVEGATDDEGSEEGMAADVAAGRGGVLRAHPDVVPEMVRGVGVAAGLVSVGGARAAYQRVVETAGVAANGGPPNVPAGAVTRPADDPERLPAAEKIRRGLVARR